MILTDAYGRKYSDHSRIPAGPPERFGVRGEYSSSLGAIYRVYDRATGERVHPFAYALSWEGCQERARRANRGEGVN